MRTLLLTAVLLMGCSYAGPHGVVNVMGAQSAGKAKGATYGPTGQKKGEWSLEDYATDNTTLPKEAGKTARFYRGADAAEVLLPQLFKNPNNTPPVALDPNKTPPLPLDPNKTPPLPLDPNKVPK